MSRPDNTESIAFASRDHVFIDSVLAGEPAPARRLNASLVLPPGVKGPVPAAILLHTSSGPGALEWSIAKPLLAEGVAVAVADSFTGRDIDRTGDDQTAVTETMMMADAYGLLAALDRDPRIDATRTALIGFSKGGTAALYGAVARLADAFAGDGPRFAAHIAFYPWCGADLASPATTGAAIMVFLAGRDGMTDPAQCLSLARSMRRADGRDSVHARLYADARHAFNHPAVGGFSYLPMLGQTPGDCHIAEQPDGTFRETSSGTRITGASYRDIIGKCLGRGGSVGYDEAASRDSLERTLSLLRRTLFPQ